jgi:uncharacterized phage-associated protein
MESNAISVFDVAAYIIETFGEITHMRLQKLVYYAQAWSLVWHEQRLFVEPIQAWANGPFVACLYDLFKHHFKVGRDDLPEGDSSRLSDEQKIVVQKVLEFYGRRPIQWLSDVARCEDPWRLAHKGLAPGERGLAEITAASMEAYYSGLIEE